MSAVLRNNTVSRIFSFSTQKTQIDFFTQTLNTLNLYWNKIGDKGAEHLSAALRNNTVSGVFSSSTQKTQIDFFIQTLTVLNLRLNVIGDKGAEHLSAALRNNTVSRIFSSSTQNTHRPFHTDTHRIKSRIESNRRERSRTFVCCTSKQHSESNFLFFDTKDTSTFSHRHSPY